MRSGVFVSVGLALLIGLADPAVSISADAPTPVRAVEVAPLTIVASEEVPCDPKRPVAARHHGRRKHPRHAVRHRPRVHRRVAVAHRAPVRRRPVVAARVHSPKPIRAVAVKPASQRCYVYRRDRLTRASLPLQPERLVRAAEPTLAQRAPLTDLVGPPQRAATIAQIPSGGGSGFSNPLSPVGPVGPGGGGGTPTGPGGGGGTPTGPGGGTPSGPGGGGGVPANPVAAAPEPGTWALMITGVGLAGLALRRRRYRPLRSLI